MNKFELKIKLKQHTPIIHFQPNQYGATLRATELKPKLDRFLIEKLGGEKSLRAKHPNWFNNKNHPSLDYKVKVMASNVTNTIIKKDDKIPSYFGNMGDDYKKSPKSLSYTEDLIDINVFSFQDYLKNEIIKNINEFFLTTNFGTRQSKGFGCFTVNEIIYIEQEKIIRKKIDTKSIETELKKNFKYILKTKKKNNDYDSAFNFIEKEYQKIKNNLQTKSSYLKEVFEKDNIKWEKEIVMKKLVKNTQKKVLDLTDNSTEKFISALLGLAGSYSYPENDNKTVNIIDESKEIERFQSPLTFKSIDKTVYMLISDIPDDILDKTFLFYEGEDKGKNALTIKTPKETKLNEIINKIIRNKKWESVI